MLPNIASHPASFLHIVLSALGSVKRLVRPLQGRLERGGLPPGLDKLDPGLFQFGLFKASKAVHFSSAYAAGFQFSWIFA